MRAKQELWLSMLLLSIMFVVPRPCFSISWPIQCGRHLAPITSAFGPRCEPQNRFHAGIDIRVWNTRNVVAVEAGMVVDVQHWGPEYKWSVILRHGWGSYIWYSGYHHMNTEEEIFVDPGQSVTKGQLIAIAGGDPNPHLHFNLWFGGDTPSNDTNTIHPLRLFGDQGQFYISVCCPWIPVAALQVDHLAQLLEVGVGVGKGPDQSPHYTYSWNLEGNVRTYSATSGWFVPGACYSGADAVTGVSPTGFSAGQGTSTYFTFPTSRGDWILHDSDYTYALSVDGHRVTIEYPVSGLFVSLGAGVCERGVTVRWEVSEEDMEPADFFVYKGLSCEAVYIVNLDVRKESPTSFSFTDTNVERGGTYYYQVSWVNTNQPISSGMIEVVIPGSRSLVFLGAPSPNPFKGEIFTTCQVPRGAEFDLSVYDVAGRRIKTLRKGSSRENEFTVVWDGTNNRGIPVVAGCYFFRLTVRGHAPMVRKVLVLE